MWCHHMIQYLYYTELHSLDADFLTTLNMNVIRVWSTPSKPERSVFCLTLIWATQTQEARLHSHSNQNANHDLDFTHLLITWT